MKSIIIVGAGEVGYNVARRLSGEQWDVVVIDRDPAQIDRVNNSLDVQTYIGSGSSPKVLRAAGVERADMLLAVADSDEINIVASLMASIYAPPYCQKIARIRDSAYTDDPRLFTEDSLGIDMHINPESAAATKILHLLSTPQATDVISFAEGRVLLLGIRLPQESPLCEKTFAEIGALYPDRRLLVAAIEREGRVIIPRGSIHVHAGDTLFLVATPEKLNTVLESLGIVPKPLRRVAIAGGGRIGLFLAERLEKQGVSIRLIDRDRSRCAYLAERLHRSVILHGDSTDRNLLAQENIPQMDAFVAVTGDEEENILSSLMAKRMGAQKVITLVNKVAYSPLVRNIGVDAAISPRQVATNLILHFIRRGRVLKVDELGEEQAEVIELVVEPASSVVGTPLWEAAIPKDVLIGAVVREDQVIVPDGQTVIQPDDRIIIFTLRGSVSQVEKAFTSSY